MKLAVSNVCWYQNEIYKFIDLISERDCEGIELAPSMFWQEPVEATPTVRRELRRYIESKGLKVTGIQALLFTHPEMKIFEGEDIRKKSLQYFLRLMDLCNDLGGEVLVYGSPKSRNIDNINSDEAYKIAVDFFGEVGEGANRRKVFFCIEPLGRTETNFINTIKEAESIIDVVQSPGLGLHIDAKALIDEGEWASETLSQSFARAKHVHVNDPGLLPPGTTGFDHTKISEKVRESAYSRFVSIEMKRNDLKMVETILKAIDYVKKTYLELIP